jgi:hypothetical protein
MVKGTERKKTNKSTAASEQISADKPQYEQSSQEAGQGPSESSQTTNANESMENAEEEGSLLLESRKRKRKDTVKRTACAPCAKAKRKVLTSVKSMYSDVRSVSNRTEINQ